MDDLKYLALTYIDLQEDLSIKEKNELAKYVVEGNEDQIATLLVEGTLMEVTGVPEQTGLFGGKALTIGGNSYGGIQDTSSLQKAIDDALRKKANIEYKGGYETGKSHGIEQGQFEGFAAAGIAALVITVGYKVYKRFLSKAARACKQFGGEAKTGCMNKYKIQAKKAQVAELRKGVTVCNKSKNPEKCKAKIGRKINTLKAKLGEV